MCLRAPFSVNAALSFRCIQGILRDRLVILVTHQVQFALQADKLLALKEVDAQINTPCACARGKVIGCIVVVVVVVVGTKIAISRDVGV